VPHPDGLPDLFVDRSLGRIQVPALLRQAGLRLTTLAERYGIPADETVSDERWLRDAGQRGEVVLMKDERIRYRPAEKAAVIRWRVRAFCLGRRDLTGQAMADLYLSNLDRMAEICSERVTGVFVVTHGGIRVVDLGQTTSEER
jgi:hypothetical protein